MTDPQNSSDQLREQPTLAPSHHPDPGNPSTAASGGASEQPTIVPQSSPDSKGVLTGEPDEPATLSMPDSGGETTPLSEKPIGAGKEFAGYVLENEIARGGMGVVYKARQKSLNRTVALKMILSGQLAGEDEIQRFRSEAEAAANLDHPGIVPIYEIGQHAGQHYFSMGFVDGESLAAKIADGPLSAEQSARLTRKIAEAVGYANANGVIHRDLKPPNVLIDAGGDPRVTDFGLAKRVEGDSNLTATGQILGTPSFMPPEQAAGQIDEIDARADVYAIGAILYNLLTGRPPFQAATAMDTMIQVLENEPLPPSRLIPSVPRDLETICLKCLAKEKKRRYNSAEELAAELDRFLQGESIMARPVSRVERGWRWCKRRPLVASLSAIVLLLLLGVSIAAPLIAIRESGLKRQSQQAAQNEMEARKFADLARRDAEKARKTAEDKQAEAEDLAARLSSEKQRAIANLYSTTISLAHREWLANNVARAEQLLSEAPREFRHWEWHYLKSLCRTEQFNLRGHTNQVLAVRFAPGRKQLATHGQDQTIKIWSLDTGSPVATHKLASDVAALGPTGERFAELAGGRVRVRDLHTGAVRGAIDAPKPPARVEGIALDRTGRRLAMFIVPPPDGKHTRQLHIADVQTGKVSAKITGLDENPFKALRFSRDGQRIICLAESANSAGVWDTQTGKRITRFIGHVLPVSDVQFSPVGSMAATASFDGTTKLWKVSTGELLHTLRGHQDIVMGAAFSEDGKWLATCGKDRSVKIWDVQNGLELLTVRGNSSVVMDVQFGPDGSIATACADATAKVWNIQRQLSAEQRIGRELFEEFVKASKVPDDQRDKLLASMRGMVYDHVSQQWRSEYGHAGPVIAVAFADGGSTYLSAAQDSSGLSVRAVNTQTGKLLWSAKESKAAAHVATSRAGGLAAAAFQKKGSGAVKVWEVASGKERLSLEAPADRAQRVAFSHDGRLLAAGGRSNNLQGTVEVKIWETKTGNLQHTLKGHIGSIQHLAFTPDGKRLATAGSDGIRFWDVETGEPGLVLGVLTLKLAFHPQKNVLATSHIDGAVRLWDTTSGERIGEMQGSQVMLTGLAFSPDGKRIVTCSDNGETTIWDPQTLQRLLTMRGHTHQALDVAFSPDGRRIGSAGYDGVVNIWDSQHDPVSSTEKSSWQVVFRDDFSRQETGADWTVVSGNWKTNNGRLRGQLVTSPAANGGPMTAANIYLANRLPAALDIRFEATCGAATGFQFGLSGDKSGVVAELLGVENPFLLTKGAVLWVSNGPNNYAPHTRNSRLAFEPNKKYAIRFTRNQDTVAVYVDGAEVFSADIRLPPTPNFFIQGIYGAKDTEFFVDNLEIRAPQQAVRQLEAKELASKWFDDHLLREDVAARLNSDRSIDSDLRDQVLKILERLPAREPSRLNKAAREILLRADRSAEDNARAVRLAQSAIDQQPDDSVYQATLGAAHYRAGRFAEAVKLLKPAFQRQIENRGAPSPFRLGFLALAEYAAGDREESYQRLEKLRDYSLSPAWERKGSNAALLAEVEAKLSAANPPKDDQRQRVRELIITTQLGGWSRHDIDGYLAPWSPNGTTVLGRGSQPGKYDVVLGYRQMRDQAALKFNGKPKTLAEYWPAEMAVKVDGENALVDMLMVEQMSVGFTSRRFAYRLSKAKQRWSIDSVRIWKTREGRGTRLREFTDEFYQGGDQQGDDAKARGDLRSLAVVRFNLGRYREAQQAIKELTAKDPKNPALWQLRFSMAIPLGDVEDILHSQKNFMDLAPKHLGLRRNLLALLAATGRTQQARKALDEMPSKTAEDWYAKVQCAFAYADEMRRLGRFSEAQHARLLQFILDGGRKSGALAAPLHDTFTKWLQRKQHWLLIGPFASGPNFQGFDKPFDPEARASLGADARTEYEVSGRRLHWKPHTVAPGRYIDLLNTVAPKENVVAYAQAQIISEKAQTAVLLLGSDDGAKVWLGGELILAKRVHRAFSPARDRVEINLQAGVNPLLIKIDQAASEWGFAVDIVDKEGAPLALTWAKHKEY